MTLASVFLASQLVIDSDLRALLPKKHPVVQAIDHVERNFGAVGSINVVVEGGTVDGRHASPTPSTTASLATRCSARSTTGSRATSSSSTRSTTSTRPRWPSSPIACAPGSTTNFVRRPRTCAWTIRTPTRPGPADLHRRQAASVNEELGERTGFTDYYEREGIEALVVFLRPTGSSADLEFAAAVSERMFERVEAVFARDGPWTGTGMRFNSSALTSTRRPSAR
ncbi:hypothetical protein G6O69_37505 [Pseudenhygromyxa sp. WMMC2535]|uniref:hypothetical protein n=1 Tax=Pseudenhygromyxa sp. WMMC2535 TaxID=2712867 RepID=UPI0015962D7B|nr:hypothetical protein [Pseudenhygromyxa sp. WMMC2535]NVB43571.1 hypothetical protein [Pseudenhygromyxa sp. WMMC2535]